MPADVRILKLRVFDDLACLVSTQSMDATKAIEVEAGEDSVQECGVASRTVALYFEL